MKNRLLVVFVVSLFTSLAAAQDVERVAQAIDRDALFFLAIPSVDSLVDGLLATGIPQHESVQALLRDLESCVLYQEGLVDDEENNEEWLEMLTDSFKSLPFNGALAISATSLAGQVEFTLFVSVNADDSGQLGDQLIELRNGICNWLESISVIAPQDRAGESALYVTEGGIEIFEIEIHDGSRPVPKKIYWFFYQEQLVCSTNADLIKSTLDRMKMAIQGHSRPVEISGLPKTKSAVAIQLMLGFM